MDYLMHSFSSYQDRNFLLVSLVSHILVAIPLWKLAKKTKEEPAWFAWVPILNAVLALKIARKPYWWLLLFLIPIVNLFMAILLMMALCERVAVNKWWGLLGFISPANLILLYVLAFVDHGTPPAPEKGTDVPDAKPASPPEAPAQPAPEPQARPPKPDDPDLSMPEAPKNG